MNNAFFSLLMAGAQGGGSGDPKQTILSFLPFVAIIGIFYFLIIRPQNKKQKETQRMLAELKKGDRIVTIGGIHGVISNVRENSVIVRVDENTKMEFTRSAIASVEAQAKAKDDDKAEIESPSGGTEEAK